MRRSIAAAFALLFAFGPASNAQASVFTFEFDLEVSSLSAGLEPVAGFLVGSAGTYEVAIETSPIDGDDLNYLVVQGFFRISDIGIVVQDLIAFPVTMSFDPAPSGSGRLEVFSPDGDPTSGIFSSQLLALSADSLSLQGLLDRARRGDGVADLIDPRVLFTLSGNDTSAFGTCTDPVVCPVVLEVTDVRYLDSPTVIPLPPSGVALLAGMVGIGLWRRRARRTE